MKMKCGRCDNFASMDAFRVFPGTNEFVCEDCFRELSASATYDSTDDPVEDIDVGGYEEFDDELDEPPEETISQKANRIWRQRQIAKLEEEYEVLDAELDSLRDDIGYDRITMDEEDCLVGETIYGLQIQDRLEEIKKELVLLRSKQ